MSTRTIIIFGASGDLTFRKLIPALFRLDIEGLLPDDAVVVGVARSPFTPDQFREQMAEKVQAIFKSGNEGWKGGAWTRFARRLVYVQGDGASAAGLKNLHEFLAQREGSNGGDRVYYLSVKPDLYAQIACSMAELGMNKEDTGYRRLVIEKPFGTDLESARTLTTEIQTHFRERQIYRIDHYMGKETVQNILALRFANTMFEPLWNSQYIDHVQISVAEKVDVKDRADYYDKSGVLRDMFQSHLLQVMTMVCMEAPSRFNSERIRNEKIKVLESIVIPTEAEAAGALALGQYHGYHGSKGVREGSRTPTYAAIRLMVDNRRWTGVPFYIRSGKAMNTRLSEIVIQFRQPPHNMFQLKQGTEFAANRLVLRIQPDEGIQLSFQTKVPAVDTFELAAQELKFGYKTAFPDKTMPEAYERLLLDAVKGDSALFMRADEILQSWQIMDPLIAASENAANVHPEAYSVGTTGPACADALLARDGRKWHAIG